MDTDKAVKNMPFLDLVWHYKYLLALYTFIFSFGSFTVLYLLGLVPAELQVLDNPINPIYSTASSVTQVMGNMVELPKNTETKEVIGQLPKRIIISKIQVDSFISNPTVTDASILNEALLRGSVRYPGSGTLGYGNMFIFGHSSRLEIVNNQAYRAFNHLKQMSLGDEIKVMSEDKEYTYSVTSVSLTDSDQKLVDFSQKKNMLTISTCDVFGQKQERYVVEAKFIKSVPLI